MKSRLPNIVPSGVEPVDKLIGGLESNQLYLVHGDAAGKSLFGIEFLIEGLKRGENGALVIRYSPEDAVRRFARLGYDCLEDVYSGRLVILEYSNDIIQQIARLRELTPVLRELEWLLGETRAERLVFDPVTNLVLGEEGNLQSRVREFASWATSFGATVVLVANADSEEVIEEFRPLVEESFRFEAHGEGEQAEHLLAFEKSSSIHDQAIEVDPARGLFLLGRQQAAEHIFSKFQVAQPAAEAEPVNVQAREIEPAAEEPLAEILMDEEPVTQDETEKIFEGIFLSAEALLNESPEATQPDAPEGYYPAEQMDTQPLSEEKARNIFASYEQALHDQTDAPVQTQGGDTEPPLDLFSDLLDELAGDLEPLELDALDEHPAPALEAVAEPVAASPIEDISEENLTEESGKMSERDIDAIVTSRAVEILLRPPESQAQPASHISIPDLPAPANVADATQSAQPKDFNVLVIDDDASSCEAVAQTLGDYTVEVVHDGVSGLAKLISFKPDLIILDVDLPIIDGFKVLAHIRTSLNMPIIIVSGSHMRASDRVLAAELGADYYLTKPFSAKELRQKARQLIARYRGIASWIITSPTAAEPRAQAEQQIEKQTPQAPTAESAARYLVEPVEEFVSYEDFVAQVEKSVKAGIDNGSAFSIVGCRLPEMTANGGVMAIRLYELVRTLVRETDLVSTNPRNDLVILLADADTAGARAFIARMREQVLKEMNLEPTVWVRSFPDLEEATDSNPSSNNTGNSTPSRRASDRVEQEGNGGQLRSSSSPVNARSASI